MNKYNLVLAAFIGVIASTSYLLGFFSASYVGKLSEKEHTEAVAKLTDQYQDIINFAKDDELFKTYDFYTYESIKLNDLIESNLAPKLVQSKKDKLAEVVPSLECMLAKFADPKMRDIAKSRINETKKILEKNS